MKRRSKYALHAVLQPAPLSLDNIKEKAIIHREVSTMDFLTVAGHLCCNRKTCELGIRNVYEGAVVASCMFSERL